MRRGKNATRDTDDLVLGRELRKALEDGTEADPNSDCQFFTLGRFIAVTLHAHRGGSNAVASVLRVAWAIAHPAGHVGRDEVVEHAPEGCRGYSDRRWPCINPEHLVKRKG